MPPAPRRRTLVFVGNCQAELLQRAAAAVLPPTEFSVAYRSVDSSQPAASDAADPAPGDIVLLQDIQDVEALVGYVVSPGATVLRFPFLRFASPWPYDDFNGLRDVVARQQDDPVLQTTSHYDGILGRLRRLVPDPQARFEAYKARAVPNILDPARVHDFECRRLEALDERFDVRIGRRIVDEFRRVPLFHTVNRPGGALLAMVLDFVFERLGLGVRSPAAETLDDLASLQVPVHPAVADRLSIEWATEDRRYRQGDSGVTWEQYVRGYIQRYG